MQVISVTFMMKNRIFFQEFLLWILKSTFTLALSTIDLYFEQSMKRSARLIRVISAVRSLSARWGK